MPNRILKESICQSENINRLSWFEEVVWTRLIVNADDYGRLDGRLAMLRSRLFPLKDPEALTLDTVDVAIKSLVRVNLIFLYDVDDMPYIQIITWDKHQRIRNSRSKYPEPPRSDDNSPQSAATCGEPPFAEIIDALNKTLGTNYRPETENTREYISVWWNAGYILDDFLAVIKNQNIAWGKDDKMRDFLRPVTLFGKNFESYLQNAGRATQRHENDFFTRATLRLLAESGKQPESI